MSPSRCPFLTLLAAALAASPGFAQKARYDAFGRACPGTGAGDCAVNNPGGGQLLPMLSFTPVEYAVRVRWLPIPLVQGFSLYTRNRRSTGTVTVTARIYLADQTGKPKTTPVASTSMTVGPKLGWYRANFAKPVPIPGAKPFFISWSTPSSILMRIFDPMLRSGMRVQHYQRRAGSSGAWNGPLLRAWAYKIHCAGAGIVPPWIEAGSLPHLGGTLVVRLAQARPSTGAVLLTGVSNTQWGPFQLPLNLKLLGAPACDLAVSPDLSHAMPTTTTGTARVSIPIPNQSTLLGARFHQQWAVFDPKANGLGFAFSFGATARIGR